jgi:hypothetical protein
VARIGETPSEFARGGAMAETAAANDTLAAAADETDTWSVVQFR